jgi:hypothetical protein
MVSSDKCSLGACSAFIFVVCVICSMLFANSGCIDGYCLSYIHTNGLVIGHHSSTYMYKDTLCYKIYTDVIWSDSQICKYEIPGRHYKNVTIGQRNINDKVEIYVKKSNRKRCSINNRREMETNAIGSIVFVIFAGLIFMAFIYNCLQPGESRIHMADFELSKV